MFCRLAILCGVLNLVSCATIFPPITTHGNHHHHHQHTPTGPTHEPNEKDRMTFFYDYLSHYFIAKSSSSCYFMSLNPDEQNKVHTRSGIEELEFSMIRMIHGDEDTVAHEQLLDLSTQGQKGCASKTLYKVGNAVTKQPTMTVPIL